MNKEQEAKFEKWYNSSASWGSAGDGLRRAWQACLEANGIGEDGRRMDMFQGCTHQCGETAGSTTGPNGYPRTSRTIDKDVESNLAEAIPDGYFKIGEEVEVCLLGPQWHRWTIKGVVMSDGVRGSSEHVRRIPAWKPKDGEAVFALDSKDRVHVGIIVKNEPRYDGYDYGVRCQDGEYSLWSLKNLKPFDASKIGKPWSEI